MSGLQRTLDEIDIVIAMPQYQWHFDSRCKTPSLYSSNSTLGACYFFRGCLQIKRANNDRNFFLLFRSHSDSNK